MKDIRNNSTLKKSALSFVLLMGIVSLFSDMTHEGARSIYGAYLGLAGVSAATLGFVTGFGEFFGYSFRLITGYIADKTKSYWFICIIGYAINMICIPLIALIPENGWKYACVLIIIERMGKAIRYPAKNTLVSFAGKQIGGGKAFAIQEFLDQIGAFSGPLLLFIVMLLSRGSDQFLVYRICFAVLLVPAILTMFFLIRAKQKFPNPEHFETAPQEHTPFKANRSFFLYMIAISLFAFGFLDFPLITLHVSKLSIIEAEYLPLLYAGAMLVDAFAALIWGWLYDKYGVKVLMYSMALSAFFTIFVFLFHSLWLIAFGILLWGIGMGAQETILKSTVSSLIPAKNRATGFGVFETSFGIFWFLGSWGLGALYDFSIIWMVVVSLTTQLLAIPFIYRLCKKVSSTLEISF